MGFQVYKVSWAKPMIQFFDYYHWQRFASEFRKFCDSALRSQTEPFQQASAQRSRMH